MKFLLVIAAVAASVLNIDSVAAYKHNDIQARHRDIGRSIVLNARAVAKSGKNSTVKTNKGRCKKKTSSIPSSTSTSKSKSTEKAQSNAPKASKSSSKPQSGVLRVSPSCGDNGASNQISKTGGPNGNEDWINCGLGGGGWQPPHVNINDLVYKDIDAALATPGNPYGACAKYVGLFKKYGNQYGVPPIFVAAFAMQESSCNAYISNGGLMQITSDKCGGAPGGDCANPDFNVRVGTKYFADVLSSVGGNVFEAVGQYNGWYRSMTVGAVLSRASCQQNLDYLQQFFNGWIQAVDPYSMGLGHYHNGGGCAS